jgi:hypothetical protein
LCARAVIKELMFFLKVLQKYTCMKSNHYKIECGLWKNDAADFMLAVEDLVDFEGTDASSMELV